MEQTAALNDRTSVLKLFLIEDNTDHSTLIKRYVRALPGLEIADARNLKAGHQRLSEGHFHAALLDLNLPDSTGLETLERTVTRHPDLAVIVLTTLDDEQLAIDSVKKGAQDYLTKDNLTPEVLRRSIHYAVERKRIERALLSTEEQLRQSQKMEALGRVAGGVAHDFNNLLTIINGYSEELLRRLESDSRAFRQVEKIRKAGERAARLTSQLLTFTRKQAFTPEVLELREVVVDTARMLPPLIGKKIDLKVVEGPSGVYVKADPNQLSQVVLNLAINARDAMPDGGELIIEIGADETGGSELQPGEATSPAPCAFVRVADSGTGMDRETVAKIFDPFFTTKKGCGTGLGLSTVYGIVTQHGGEISVSTEEGRGTTFTIRLPRTEISEERVPEMTLEDDAGRAHETILLVDDEGAIRELLRQALEREGYVVLEADGGESALEICERHQSDLHLLVTDIVMPDLSGGALARRALERRPDMKVIFMSGYAEEVSKELEGFAGAGDFLQKPFSTVSFMRRVRATLSRAPLLDGG